MVDSSEYFPSRFLSGEDVKPGQNATVIDVKEEMVGPEGAEKPVLVIYFKDIEKGLKVNKTIYNKMVEFAGSRLTENWINTTVGLIAVNQPFKDQIFNVARLAPPHRKKG